MNDLVQLPLACISNALPKKNPKSTLNYPHPLDALPTMPCYFVVSDDNSHTKSMHHKSILWCQPTIDLFVQNMPHKASNVLECATRSDADVTS